MGSFEKKQETHLFILWNRIIRDKYKCDYILHDLNKSFKVLCAYEITWSDSLFGINLQRFSLCYGDLLRRSIEAKGIGAFVVVVINIEAPTYEIRRQSNGSIAKVCVETFEKKINIVQQY